MLFRTFHTKSCFLPAVIVILLVRAALSQETTGTITGTVTDAQDALVPDAVLTLSNLEQGASRNATSNRQGIYEFKFLEPGRYQVTASRTGFRQFVKTDLDSDGRPNDACGLRSEAGRRESIHLRQRCQIADAEYRKLGSKPSDQLHEVADLPLNGRNFDDLIPLMAGATTGMQGQSNGGYNLNGSRSDSNLFIIEGQSNTDFNNNLLIRPEIDAIQEFQILTATFSAEYGKTGGGIVSIQLKSGGNQFHASLFEFLRNDKLDANNFFANDVPLVSGQTSASREELRRNQFGGHLRRSHRPRQDVLSLWIIKDPARLRAPPPSRACPRCWSGREISARIWDKKLCTITHFSARSSPTRVFRHRLLTRRR